MAQRLVLLPGIGEVLLAKRRGSKNMRLSILPDGRIRVGLPSWVPYSAGVAFAKSRSDWIAQHSHAPRILLKDGDLIGKSYRLSFKYEPTAAKTLARTSTGSITVKSNLPAFDQTVQDSAIKAAERALKKEAENLFPRRLNELGKKNGFKYKQLRIKRLKSRWGSCSSQNIITLNYFLVQLPWELIDYVMLHELLHTKYANHGRDFWTKFEEIAPGAKNLRKEINSHKPAVMPN